MSKREKFRKIKNKKDLPPYEVMDYLDSKSMFASVFFPYFEGKQAINNKNLNKSKSVMFQGLNKCNDKVWGTYISDYWISKFGLDNIRGMKSLYNTGSLAYDGDAADFYRKIQYFEEKFENLDKNKKEILLYDTAKNVVIPYLTQYCDTIVNIFNTEDVNDYIDVIALADFNSYLDMTISKINKYLNYVDTISKENFDENEVNKLMTIAISAIKIAEKRIKQFEFELEKVDMTLKQVKDEDKKELILRSCKYLRIRNNIHFFFTSDIVSNLKYGIPKDVELQGAILPCSMCKKEDYNEYLDFMMKTKSRDFDPNKYDEKDISDNWMISEVSNGLMNSETFNKVLKDGKFQNIDELLEIAKIVFDGVKLAIDNSPLKDFVNLSFSIDTSYNTNKSMTAFALTNMTDNSQDIVFFKEPFERKLQECNDINLLIYTIVTIMHESLHGLECAIRGLEEFNNEGTTNKYYKILEEKGFISNNELTQEDYFLLACLSPSLLESIKEDSENHHVDFDIVLKVMSEHSSGVFDRDKQTEINAHRFSSLSTQAILKNLSGMYAGKGDMEEAENLEHYAEYDVYQQAYQLNPGHLEDRERLDDIMENLINDLNEVHSVDAIEYILSNHVITSNDSDEARKLQERSKKIFKAYYLNLSKENREKLKKECLKTLKFSILEEISDILKFENVEKPVNNFGDGLETNNDENNISSQPKEPEYLTFTTDEIIEVCENAKKYGMSADNLVKIHYEYSTQSFKDAFEYFCNKNDLESALNLMPLTIDIKQEDLKFYIDKSVELLFNVPESKRNSIEVEFFISDIIVYIKAYQWRTDGKQDAYDYTEELEQLNKENERIKKSLEEQETNSDYQNTNKNRWQTIPLSIPQNSSADISEKE